jgi:hypothetical protein
VDIKWRWPELLLALHEAVVDELVHAAGFLVRQARLQPLAKVTKYTRSKSTPGQNVHWSSKKNIGSKKMHWVRKYIGSKNTSGQKIHRVKKYIGSKNIGSKNIGSKNTSGQKIHRVKKYIGSRKYSISGTYKNTPGKEHTGIKIKGG